MQRPPGGACSVHLLRFVCIGKVSIGSSCFLVGLLLGGGPQPPVGATACPGPWSPPLGWEAVPITEWRLLLRPEEWLWSLGCSSGSPGD